MQFKKKIVVRRAVVLMALAMLVTSSLFFPVSAVTVTDDFDQLQADDDVGDKSRSALVHIYYDGSSDEVKSMVPRTVSALLEHGFLVEIFDIESILHLESTILSLSPDYAVYYFNSSQQGIKIHDETASWERLAETIARTLAIKHVFGVGSAYNLKTYLDNATNLFFDDSDVLDVELGRLYAEWTIADTMSKSDWVSWRNTGESLRETVLRDFSENVNEYFAKGIIPEDYTGERVPDIITDPNLTESWVTEDKQFDNDGNELEPLMRLGVPAVEENYIALKEISIESGIGGPIGWLLDTVLGSLIDLGFQDLAIHMDAAENINAHFVDLVDDARVEVQDWFNEQGFNMTDYNFNARIPDLLPRQMFELWSRIEQLILDSWYDVDHYIGEFFDRVINTPVQTDLAGLVPVFLFRLGTPINLGSNFASFGAVLRVKLLPDFEIDKEPFETFMRDSIMGDFDLAAISDVEDAFLEVRKFIDVIPVMDIDFAICAFLPTGNDWAQGLMAQFTIDFFGHAWMELAFPSLDATNTERSFIDVREWGFRFELDADFALSISAFLAPGPGGVISTILDWFSDLLSVSIQLTLSIIFEISKKYQGQGLPALSTILFDIVVGVTLDIRILVVVFKGTLQVGLRFEQQSGILEDEGMMTMALAENPDPVIVHTLSDIATSTIGIYITLYASLYFAIDLFFTSFGTHFGGPWTTVIDVSDSWGSSTYGTEAADLTDTDMDGLPDDFETTMSASYAAAGFALSADGFYLNPASADTDSDGLNDKLELELRTAPQDPDTDNDLLTDYQEHVQFLTNPLLADTDRDNLTDYQEVMIYGTSPFVIDTDGDMLYDWYEINTVYDITYTAGTYGAVESVEIGGVLYNDRTDPLNPDTDGDLLLDGEEWDNGVMYLNDTELALYQYAHYQYTHPLDFDTDDDSLAWFWTGDGWGVNPFASSENVIWDMSDGVEVMGQIAVIPDAEGFPEVKLVKTNPVYQDTDNDTAWGAVALFRTDGYELSLDPQNDPTNGDEDSDGLKDGYEAIGPGGSGTSPQNPDTDNDHLPDYEDFMLPTDPRKPDTDEDMVLDGDEYFLYGTNPLLNDTDFDGLTDGEELYFFYSNPLVRDSDVDGLTDGEEVLIWNTDPLHSDTDRDMLKDGYEVYVSHTDPRVWDTDLDWLGDGEELLVYHSNPLDWDTDHDSLDYPNEFGDMTLPLSDGMEVLIYGTDPTKIDTDSDGLLDSQEIYLAQGWPGQDPILLDPLSADTDNDTLPDGLELILENVSIITYPYEALVMRLRYGSSPASNDTDGDLLNDALEVQYNTYPDDQDSDDDLLSDYIEIFVTMTDPLSNDTDGDEIPDNLESWEGIMANTTPPGAMIPPFLLAQEGDDYYLYPTDVNDPDTDDDFLPDGLELVYGTNPLEWDENHNGVADGFEWDFDDDGLSDGEEFYLNHTWMMELPIGNDSAGIWHWTALPGGFNNPDSDGDGLKDGIEVHTYGSNPTSSDSDGDGISDMDEVHMGGNPIVPITSGWPFWVLPTLVGIGAFVVGMVTTPMLRFTIGKVRGRRGKAPTKKTSGKTATSGKTTTRSSKKKTKEGAAK